MEVGTLIEAHRYDDLESDIKDLVDEINQGQNDAAVQGLLHIVSEATVRFTALCNDYVVWRSGSRISPQIKIKFSRHVESFHRLITKAIRTLTSHGHTVECPPYPHTPIPIVVSKPETSGAAAALNESTTNQTTGEGSTTPRDTTSAEDSFQPDPTKQKTDPTAGIQMDSLNLPSTLLIPGNSLSTPSMPGRFVFPDIQMVEDTMRRRSADLSTLPRIVTEAERRAKEAEIDAGEAKQRLRSASRMEEEERLKEEMDRRIEDEEKEERELLRRVEEVRQRKQNLARLAAERIERVKKEERDLMANLQAQNQILRQEIQQDRTSPSLTSGAAGIVDEEVSLYASPKRKTADFESSSSAFRPIPGGNRGGVKKRSEIPPLLQPKAFRLSSPRHLFSSPDDSVREIGEVKPDMKLLITEITAAFKAQADMMQQLSTSQHQLQDELKELRKLTSPHPTSCSETPLTPAVPRTSQASSTDTLLAHIRLPDTRPPLEERWKGGRDVKSFLKKFKTLVEDFPGVTPDLVWNELSFRTSGLALQILDPFKDDEASVAIQKAKARYLRIWARTPRDVREILEEVIKGGQIKATDFNALISLIAELEDYRRQAILNGDEAKFDEAENLMAIVAARLACLEVKWSKHAIKKRNRGKSSTSRLSSPSLKMRPLHSRNRKE